MFRFKKAACVSLVASVLLVPSLASAQEPIYVEGGLPTVRVSYADLNIGREEGVKALKWRVSGAARFLCVQPGVRSLPEAMDSHACMKVAINGANEQIAAAVANYTQNKFASRDAIIRVARR